MNQKVLKTLEYYKIIEKLTNEQTGQFETIAILTTTEEQAERLYIALKDTLDVHMLSPNSSKMEKGIVITTFYLAKGLEFDSVHVAYTPVEEELTEQEKLVITLRYGLDGRKPHRQREVAQVTGISRSYVSHHAYCKR